MKLQVNLVVSPVPLSGTFNLVERQTESVVFLNAEEALSKISTIASNMLTKVSHMLQDNSVVLACQVGLKSVSDLWSVKYLLQEQGWDLLVNMVPDNEVEVTISDNEVEYHFIDLSNIYFGFIPAKFKEVYNTEEVKFSEIYKKSIELFGLFSNELFANNPMKKTLDALSKQEETLGTVRVSNSLIDFLSASISRLNKDLILITPKSDE